MRAILVLILVVLSGCSSPPGTHGYQTVAIESIFTDSVSIRALELMPGTLAFAGSKGIFGTIALADGQVRVGRISYQDTHPEFRAVAHTDEDFFMLSAGDPALLYKTGDSGGMEVVYSETGPGVFYDAMAFWDQQHGIAVGDALEGCLSILITRNGGATWSKLSCSELPEALPGEGAFAASDTNIAIAGTACWIASSKGRIYYSPDLGKSWEVRRTPLKPDLDTEGIYSLDFWDAQIGYAIGGDYTRPAFRQKNKLRTVDGGETWALVGEGDPPGYKSCVQYVPGAGGEDLVAVGFTGISYSQDGGDQWRELSKEPLYAIRFINDSVAYGSGQGRIVRLIFRK